MRRFQLLIGCLALLISTPALADDAKDAHKNKRVAQMTPLQNVANCKRERLKKLFSEHGKIVKYRVWRGPLTLKAPRKWLTLVKRCKQKENATQCRSRLKKRCRAMFGDQCEDVTLRYDTRQNYMLRYKTGDSVFKRHVASKKAASAFLIGLRKRGIKAVLMSLKKEPVVHIYGKIRYASQWNSVKVRHIKQYSVDWRPKADKQAKRRFKQALKNGIGGWSLVLYRPMLTKDVVRVKFACQLKPIKGTQMGL